MKRLAAILALLILSAFFASCGVTYPAGESVNTEEPLVWVDTTYLNALVATEVIEEEYTSKSYALYRSAYESALDVLHDPDADQFAIENASVNLSRTIDTLEKRADFTDVLALCDRVDALDRSLFTESSLKCVDDAVREIRESISPDTTQKSAEALYENLAYSIRALAAKPLKPDPKRTGKKNPTYPYTSVFPARADGEVYEVDEDMFAEVKKICAPRSADIGFFILDLNTGACITHQADRSMFQASTVKAQFCLYLFNLLEEGKASFDEELEFKKKHHSVGSGEIKNTPFGSKYKVSYLIDRALTISDNCAYHMLLERYDIKAFNKFLKDLGCKYAGNLSAGYRFGSASPRDIATIWSEIFTYTMFREYGDLFKGYLLQSAYGAVGEGIPQYEVAHKSGWTSKQFNDFAIVYAPHPYLVVTFVAVADGLEPDFVSEFSGAVSKIMEDYQSFMYEDEEFYLPEAKTEIEEVSEK